MEILSTIWVGVILIWEKGWWIIALIALWFSIINPIFNQLERDAWARENQRKNIKEIKNTVQQILYELRVFNSKKSKK